MSEASTSLKADPAPVTNIKHLAKPPIGQAQNIGLSGVLAFRQIDPWNFASRTGLLVPNPWAGKPLPATGFGTDELKVVDEAYQRTNGEALSALLKLPAAWPEQESGEA